MTARRIAEERALIREHVKKVLLFLAVIAVLVFVAYAPRLFAQSAADTIYLPVVTHAVGWATDINLTNFTGDAITVSAWFTPVNESDSDPNAPLERRMADTYLGPHERKTVEIGSLGVNGTGSLVLEGCRVHESCAPVLTQFRPGRQPLMLIHLPRKYRDISASVRVYATGSVIINGNAMIATRGDSYLAIPYWATSRLSDGPVDLPWIESDAKHSTTIGMVNASSYSTITLVFTLFDGLGVRRGLWDKEAPICPLCSVRRSAESMFPVLAATNRANRQPAGAGWWVRVEQVGSEPNEWAAKEKNVADVESCFNGCAQFIAYASVMDSSFVVTPCPPKQACVPDVHFIMPQSEVAGGVPGFEAVNQSSEIAAARKDVQRNEAARPNHTTTLRWINSGNQAPSATSEVVSLPPCSVVARPDGIRVEDAQGRTVFLLTREELMRMPPEICGPTHVETVARRTGAAQ